MARTVPGSGAVVSANFNSSYGVESFTITNGGTGYASTDPPQIVVTGTTVPNISGSFYPIILNGVITSIKILSSGSGYIPLVSTRSTAVGIASIGIIGGNSVVKSIYVKDPGRGYSSSPEVTIAAPEVISGFGSSYSGVGTSRIGVGTYLFNEIVMGAKSLVQARVKEYDQDTHTLKISNVSIGSTQPIGFYPGEVLIGQTSGAKYPVYSYVQDDTYHKYTENDEFESEADDILDFTESNPFGTY